MKSSNKKNLLEDLIENLPMALFAKDYSDGRGVFVSWNSYSESLWGLAADKVIGKTDFDFFPEEQARFFQEKDLETLKKGRTIHIPKEVVSSPIGDKFVKTWKIPILDGGNGGSLLMGLSLDITENVKLEQKLNLERAKNIHSSKLLSLGEMAAGIAHEINNPLAIIDGHNRLMLKKSKRQALQSIDLQEIANTVFKNVKRISSIIGVLRRFSRDDSGSELGVEKVGDIVDDSMALCRSRIESHGIKLECYVEDPGLEVQTSGTQISQVIVNLLNNATHAVSKLEQPWIKLEISCKEEKIFFSVTDSGKGIPPENRDRLFEPFFTTKPAGEGTGLGLSICKSIATEHLGDLFIDKDCPHTRFVLVLPPLEREQ